MPTDTPFLSRLPVILVLALAIATINIYVFYLGFIASDDSLYNSYAAAIAAGDITLPEKHWAFRWTVIVPLAGLIAMVGVSEQTILILTLGYLVALIATLTWITHRFAGPASAFWVAILAATTPLLVTLSTTVNADIPEAVFLLASVTMFYIAWYHRLDLGRLFLGAGVAAGLAMLTRETAYGIGLFYALYFLRYGWRVPRPFILLGLGALAILSIEMTCYVAAGESPFYRLISATQSHGGLNAAGAEFGAGSGNLSNSRIWGAPLALLFNQEFGLLFWFGIGCAIALRKHAGVSDEMRQFLRYMYAAGAVYFIWLGYSGTIRPLPRYFVFDLAIVLIPIAAFLAVTKRRWLRALIVFTALGASYAGLSVDNINQRFPERAIAEFALKNDGVIATDSETASRARSFTYLMGGQPADIVEHTLPGATPRYVAAVDGRAGSDPDLAATLERATEVERAEPPKLLIGRILDVTRLGGLLPPDKYWWLAVRTPGVSFYKLP